jgi:hypothetical protein
MREDVREAVGQIVQGLVNLGLPTTFNTSQLDELEVKATLDLQQEEPNSLDYRIQM